MTSVLDQSHPLVAPARPRLVVAEPQAPAVRHGSVPRERLVQRLRRATDVSLVALVAPAGYGKTTLLRQWAASDPRPFAWISLTREHDDPARLSAAIEWALAWLEPAPAGSVLVLDDAHRLQAPAALERLTATIAEQPAGSLIALASRSEPGVRFGRLRAQGALLDLRAEDLAMTRREGASLLREAGTDLPYEAAAGLVQRVEGWPAGLVLAALSLHGEPDPQRAAARFAGDDRFVADFLRDELLDALPAERRAFLTRTSVLERVSGPACDAVLGRTGSGTVLRDLARSDLMLVALDRTDTSYRYHRLLDPGVARGAAARRAKTRAAPAPARQRVVRRAGRRRERHRARDPGARRRPRGRSAVAVRGRLRHGRPSRRAPSLARPLLARRARPRAHASR